VTTRITVHLDNGADLEVDAHVFGEWAAHQAVLRDNVTLDPDLWVVTHVPNGMNCCQASGMLAESTAKRVAQALSRSIPTGLIPVLPPPYDGKVSSGTVRLVRSVIEEVLA
jgi:hypothetical protein